MTITINGTTGITNDGGYTGDGVVFADTTPANTLVTTTGGNVAVGTVTPAGSGLTLGNGKDLWLEATGYSTWKQTNYQGSYYWNNGADRLVLTGVGHLGLGTAVAPPAGVNKFIAIGDSDSGIGQLSDGVIAIYSNGVKRLQVDATGGTQNLQKFQVLTQVPNNGDFGNRTVFLEDSGAGTNAPAIGFHAPNNGAAGIFKFWGGSAEFEFRNATDSGFLSCRASAFNVSSDYRLKEDVEPMARALAKVASLKPVTYKWKDGGKSGQGFIAHELAEVFPDAVTGEKDGVDAFDNPIYQGIDTSFLVATLTAAIQEQQQLITALTARVAALDARLTSLEGTQP